MQFHFGEQCGNRDGLRIFADNAGALLHAFGSGEFPSGERVVGFVGFGAARASKPVGSFVGTPFGGGSLMAMLRFIYSDRVGFAVVLALDGGVIRNRHLRAVFGEVQHRNHTREFGLVVDGLRVADGLGDDLTVFTDFLASHRFVGGYVAAERHHDVIVRANEFFPDGSAVGGAAF